MALPEELERIAAAAEAQAASGETLAGILAAEPHPGDQVYLCAFRRDGAGQSWLALDGGGTPVTSRQAVRDAASIAALCELAEEVAGGGDLDDLISRLVAVRLTEAPAGIEEAEEAARTLQHTISPPPRAGVAGLPRSSRSEPTRRLEQALGEGGSPFAEGMKLGMAAVEQLTKEIEDAYKAELT